MDKTNPAIHSFYNAVKNSSLAKGRNEGLSSFGEMATESHNQADVQRINQHTSNGKEIIAQLFKTADESLAKAGHTLATESHNGSAFSPRQVQAVEAALKLCMASDDKINNIGKNTLQKGVTEIASESYTLPGVSASHYATAKLRDGMEVLATEKFSGQEINNVIVNTISLAASAAAQDPFQELVFPMVVMDPLTSHLSTQVTYSLFGQGYTRTSGTPVKQDKHELLLNLYKKEKYMHDKMSVLPVADAKGPGQVPANLLEDAVFTVPVYRGQNNISIAPYRFGEQVDLIYLSRTAADLAKGQTDDTDVIDKHIALSKIYLEFDKGGKKYVEIDTSNEGRNTFNPIVTGNTSETVLNFVKKHSINTSKAKDFKTNTGDLFDSADEQILTFNLTVNITVNLADGTVTTSNAGATLVEVTKAGQTYDKPESAEFKAARELMKKFNVAGYLLKATITNSNFKDFGIEGLIQGDAYAFGAGLKDSIGLKAEVDFAMKEGTDNNYTGFTIEQQSIYINQQMGAHAVYALMNFVKTLREAKEQGTLEKITTRTCTEHYVRPYYEHIDLDLTTIVDSIKSQERSEDLRRAILDNIRLKAIKMDIESNYINAVNYRFKSGKRTLVVMTDYYIASVLTADDGTGNVSERIKLTQDIDLIVAPSLYEDFRNKMLISYVTPEDNAKGHVPVLNVGFAVYAPTFNYTVNQKEYNGGIVKLLYNVLRFEHYINLPIFLEFTVTNVDKALEKIATYVKTVI